MAALDQFGCLPCIHVPDAETREDRDLLAHSMALVNEQTRCKNSIRSFLRKPGLANPATDLQRLDARDVVIRQSARLGHSAKLILNSKLAQLDSIEARLATILPLMNQRAMRRAETELLITIPGIELTLALTMAATIADINRFPKPGSLVKYSGLIPRDKSSAGKVRRGGSKRTGSRTLRWAATEAARSAVKVAGPLLRPRQLSSINHSIGVLCYAHQRRSGGNDPCSSKPSIMADPAYYLSSEEWPDTSQIVTEDDEPLDSTFQERQQKLLVDSLYASWKGPDAPRRFLALSNVGLFHAVKGKGVVPDAMVILDVDLLPCDEHKSYFVWEYGKAPDLVVEVVSKEVGSEDKFKLDKYAAIGVAYYVIYDPYGFLGERPVRAFEHHGRSYVELLHPVLLTQIGLGLTVWEGEYAGCKARFLRFTDPQGQLLWTGAERAEQEHLRAEQEHLRAEQEHLRAEQERQRAERAEAELEKLRRQLREQQL